MGLDPQVYRNPSDHSGLLSSARIRCYLTFYDLDSAMEKVLTFKWCVEVSGLGFLIKLPTFWSSSTLCSQKVPFMVAADITVGFFPAMRQQLLSRFSAVLHVGIPDPVRVLRRFWIVESDLFMWEAG